MGIRVNFQVDLSLSENTTEAKELGATPPWKGKNDQLEAGGTWRQRVDASTVDLEIDINGLANGRLLAIKTNKAISFKKNSSSGEAWSIRPLGTGATDGIFLITTDGITSLYLSNAGAEDAEVTFVVAGIF